MFALQESVRAPAAKPSIVCLRLHARIPFMSAVWLLQIQPPRWAVGSPILTCIKPPSLSHRGRLRCSEPSPESDYVNRLRQELSRMLLDVPCSTNHDFGPLQEDPAAKLAASRREAQYDVVRPALVSTSHADAAA